MQIPINKSGAIIIEGHVQGLSNTRSLGEIGIPVYVVDKTNCIARYSRYCRKYFRCPDFIMDEFSDFLIKLAERENIKDWLLLPSNDHAVFTLSKHKKKLEKYYKVITPSLDIIQNIYDKSRLLKIAEDAGVSVPQTFYFRSVDDVISKNLPYPVVTKGLNSLSFYKVMGRKAFMAENEKELKEQLSRISEKLDIVNTFAQEVIPFVGTNHTVSFTAFCVDGVIKTIWMGEKLREHPLQFGTATLCISTLSEELIVPSAKLIKSLNFTGVCEIEYLKDLRSDSYKLIEINARTWLWVGLAKSCGVDYAKILYSFVNNIEINYPVAYTVGLKWINWLTDSGTAIKALFKKELNFSEYSRSLKGKKIYAVFSWHDLFPSLIFPLFGIFLIKKRKFLN